MTDGLGYCQASPGARTFIALCAEEISGASLPGSATAIPSESAPILSPQGSGFLVIHHPTGSQTLFRVKAIGGHPISVFSSQPILARKHFRFQIFRFRIFRFQIFRFRIFRLSVADPREAVGLDPVGFLDTGPTAPETIAVPWLQWYRLPVRPGDGPRRWAARGPGSAQLTQGEGHSLLNSVRQIPICTPRASSPAAQLTSWPRAGST